MQTADIAARLRARTGDDNYTIERGRGETYDSGDWTIYGHGSYPRSSVLAGTPRRSYIASFGDTDEGLQAAREACRLAEVDYQVVDGSTHAPITPSTAPDWFDPADAGEAWGEDDY